MDCDEAIVRIYQYLDGELTVWRRRAIARHLDECPPCAHGFDFEIELRQVVASKCRDDSYDGQLFSAASTMPVLSAV